jgi:hypothetical protein
MRTRFWGGGGWALLVFASACTAIGGEKDDGTHCTSDSECDSRHCNVDVNRCEGSECKTTRDCRDGWTCKEGASTIFGAHEPSQCASTCSGCPVEWSCRAGATSCTPNPIDVAIEQPAPGTILQRGKPATAHAKVGASVDATFVSWTLDSTFAADGNDAPVTPARIGTVKLVVNVSTGASPGGGPARGTAEATYQVCEPDSGVGCNSDVDCCAPLACRDTGFGKKSCIP